MFMQSLQDKQPIPLPRQPLTQAEILGISPLKLEFVLDLEFQPQENQVDYDVDK